MRVDDPLDRKAGEKCQLCDAEPEKLRPVLISGEGIIGGRNRTTVCEECAKQMLYDLTGISGKVA